MVLGLARVDGVRRRLRPRLNCGSQRLHTATPASMRWHSKAVRGWRSRHSLALHSRKGNRQIYSPKLYAVSSRRNRTLTILCITSGYQMLVLRFWDSSQPTACDTWTLRRECPTESKTTQQWKYWHAGASSSKFRLPRWMIRYPLAMSYCPTSSLEVYTALFRFEGARKDRCVAPGRRVVTVVADRCISLTVYSPEPFISRATCRAKKDVFVVRDQYVVFILAMRATRAFPIDVDDAPKHKTRYVFVCSPGVVLHVSAPTKQGPVWSGCVRGPHAVIPSPRK